MWSGCTYKIGSKENLRAMWLKFGVPLSGELTGINEVGRGKLTSLASTAVANSQRRKVR
jgi:hypothetical protein